jgi:hypothetical protein
MYIYVAIGALVHAKKFLEKEVLPIHQAVHDADQVR